MRKPERADLLICCVVTVAQMLGQSQAYFGVLFEQLKELLVPYEGYLAGTECLGSYFIGLARYRRAGAQNFAPLRDPGNQRSALARARRQLHAAPADQVHPSRRLALDEQNRSLWVNAIGPRRLKR